MRGLAGELLERASFLRTLDEYAGDAQAGDGRLVLVSGESGMGKTALLEEFERRSSGTRWLWGACDGLLTPRPLGPLFDIAAQAGGELADLGRQEAPRDRLFTAFLAELDSPAAVTVAVIEDVHWADEATLDLLSFAGRRLGRTRSLLVATYRDDELADDHPLRSCWATWPRSALRDGCGCRRCREGPYGAAGGRARTWTSASFTGSPAATPST